MGHKTWRNVLIIIGVLIVTGAVPTGALADNISVEASIMAALTRNFFLTLDAPAGTTATESNPTYKGPASAPPSPAANVQAPGAPAGDWPSYNRTLTSERFSPLSQINTKNVGGLKVLCTYDIGQFTAFESGLIMVNNALIGSTEFVLAQPCDMRRELANARELCRQHYSGQPRCRLHGRHVVPRHRGRARPCLRFQHRQARVGSNDRGRETWRVGAVGPDCLERPRLCR